MRFFLILFPFFFFNLPTMAVELENYLLTPDTKATKRPATGPWWPSRWGENDELGALNHLGPGKVIDAIQLIKKGNIADMAHPFEMGRPDFHHRVFTLISAGSPSGGPVGKHKYMFNEEWISGEITGIGTQFDSLAHVGRQLGKDGDNNTVHYYNGFVHSEIGSRNGFKKLGVENVTPIFTRGVLIDLFAYYNNKLGLEQIITKEILQEALKNQGMAEKNIRPGDVVFWRQGRDQLWYDDPDTYNKSTPGLNKEAADWLAGLNVVAVGSDSFAMEPFPPINNRLAEIHAIFLMKHGIYMFENLDLRTLSDEKVYEFAFSFSPIPFVGAQGSPARPFALY